MNTKLSKILQELDTNTYAPKNGGVGLFHYPDMVSLIDEYAEMYPEVYGFALWAKSNCPDSMSSLMANMICMYFVSRDYDFQEEFDSVVEKKHEEENRAHKRNTTLL